MTRAITQAAITTIFPSTGQGAITAALMRPFLTDLTNAIPFLDDINTLSAKNQFNLSPSDQVVIFQPVTQADDIASFFVNRVASHAGGTHGVVNAAVSGITTVSAGNTNFEWALLSRMDNSATSGDASQNLAGYFQAFKRSTGATWATTTEFRDYLADPAAGSVSQEIDLIANGTDANSNRVMSDYVAGPGSALGFSNPTITYGIRFSAQSAVAANATITNAIYFNTSTYGTLIKSAAGTVVTSGVDLSAGTFSSNTFVSTGFNVTNAGVIGTTGIVSSGNINANAALRVGPSVLTLTTSAFGMSKMTASGSAPGATGGKLELVAGTNSGTAKLIIYAGTSATPSTILDNIGGGVT